MTPAAGDRAARILQPGDAIGILGGGQLGRMLALEAYRLGLRPHVFCSQEREPAVPVSAAHICAPWTDEAALSAFAAAVPVVTFEFENVPLECAAFLAERTTVRPAPRALEVAQDRLAEKTFLNDLDVPTAPFAAIGSETDLPSAAKQTGLPAILKTRRLGYDGKGQTRLTTPSDAGKAWEEVGGSPSILEAFVSFEREVSVILARGLDGAIAAYDIPENIHENHVLARSLVPAPLSRAAIRSAQALAARIATALDYVGVLAVELFDLGPGGLVVNEIAPRVHNSGHWTQDACLVSQFEQHIRAVAGWPLGTPERHSDAVMENLLGSGAQRWHESLKESGMALHLYGKGEMRPGRKMGHRTRLLPLGSRSSAKASDPQR